MEHVKANQLETYQAGPWGEFWCPGCNFRHTANYPRSKGVGAVLGAVAGGLLLGPAGAVGGAIVGGAAGSSFEFTCGRCDETFMVDY